MPRKTHSAQKATVLDEIIDNAIGLPLEIQDFLLMLAKGMAYTRDCITKQKLPNGHKKVDHSA